MSAKNENGAQGKCAALWEKLESSPAGISAYPDIGKMTEFAKTMDYTSLLNYEEDLQPAGRQKVLCACDGAIAKIRFIWKQQARDYFTGMFSLAEHGIMRCTSINAPTPSSSWSPVPTMVPMLALKLFRDSEASSANLVLAYKKSGQKELNFFAHALSNHFTENVKFPFKSALKIFKKYSDFPTFSGLAEFASVGQDGKPVQNPRAPYVLVLRPLDLYRKREVASTGRLIDQFKGFNAGDILYDVYAVPEPLTIGSSNGKRDVCKASSLSGCPVGPAVWRVGSLVLESSFVASQFADEQLFFRHHLFDGDLRLRPDWRIAVDTMLGAPFYDEVINTGSVWDPEAEETVTEPESLTKEEFQRLSRKFVKVEEDICGELGQHEMCPKLSEIIDDAVAQGLDQQGSAPEPLDIDKDDMKNSSGKNATSSCPFFGGVGACPFLGGTCSRPAIVEETDDIEISPTTQEAATTSIGGMIITDDIEPIPQAATPSTFDRQCAITIFTVAGCPHCKRAMSTLDDLGWEYTMISLSEYPGKRKDLLSLVNRLTVPQVFFNAQHIGGAEELNDLITRLDDSAAFYAQIMAQARPEDPRLKVQRTSLRETPIPDKVEDSDPIICIGGMCLKYEDLVSSILSGVKVKDHRKRMGLRSYPQSFKGSELLDFLVSTYKLPGRQDAVQVFHQLQTSGVFNAVEYETGAIEEGNRLYRFQAHEVGLWSALNVERVWNSENSRTTSPMQSLKGLDDQFCALKTAHTDKRGQVDYLALNSDPKFPSFTLGVCALQGIDLCALDQSTRKAFVINLYNMLVQHATAVLGQPTTDLQRAAFFNGVRYKIGGLTYSLHDLENGILRGNRQPPYHLKQPFAMGDTRSSSVLPADHRIHFALNCGAMSCPAIKWYTAENIEEELSLASIGWVAEDTNVRIDMPKRILFVSKIMKWFACDFGKSSIEIASTIRAHAVGDKKAQLEGLLGSKFRLKYLPYDWSANIAASHTFTDRCYSCFVTQ